MAAVIARFYSITDAILHQTKDPLFVGKTWVKSVNPSVMFSGNGDLSCKEAARLSRMAEARRLGRLWFGETVVRDATILAAVAAINTKEIGIGTSIINVFTRSPGQLAMLAGTLNELSSGRFTLGLGTSTAAIVEGWHGQHYSSPAKRLEEVIALLRNYFSGERFSFSGESYSPSGARLKGLPRPAIALAALNDVMVRKAAILADQVILNLSNLERVRQVREMIDMEARKTGRIGRPKLSMMLYAYVLGDGDQGLMAAKDLFTFYSSAPAYRKLFSRLGYKREAEEMERLWSQRDRSAIPSVISRAMIDDLMVVGGISDLRQRVRQFEENGVDEVMIAPCPTSRFVENADLVIREV